MIYKNKEEIANVYKGGKAITSIYKGLQVVWEAIKSAFGKGFWINDKPWNNEDGFKN